MALDLETLWDFDRPAETEKRLRAALATATGDEVLILRTQIARTLGLRGQFAEAHRELDALAPLLSEVGPEPRVRAMLERGRVWRSAGDPARARPFFVQAFDLAHAAGLQELAADALHMIPLVESALEGQIAGARRLIDYARAATDTKARNWEGPALNNLGVALNDAGRHDEALAIFREALAFRERLGRPGPIRIARWMIANTLRRLGRIDEALTIQLDLAAQWQAAGEVDAYVFEELALLYDAKREPAEAARYRDMHRAASGD